MLWILMNNDHVTYFLFFYNEYKFNMCIQNEFNLHQNKIKTKITVFRWTLQNKNRLQGIISGPMPMPMAMPMA